ncbi:ABC transporter ATP-binding protein [Halostagnicola sp. A-GB9-2]|uniref:ABC transporter ATP-binding protein n=1 Tax=Halostagnicola sp. A-GB9-2 TaxID=3048066 RepID=UPI0031F319CC
MTASTPNSHGSTRPDNSELVRVDGLKKYFNVDSGLLSGLDFRFEYPPVRFERETVKAVDDVSFDIRRGETLGLVGESGCGKSTLARTVLRLLKPTEGDIYFEGENLADIGREELRSMRRNMQMIFQDPQSSLDPRMKVGRIVEEPMKAHDMLDTEGRRERAKELLNRVGLDPEHYYRYPHSFSGGQRQRINLARALSVNPDFVVCDEPVASLDVSIQAQVLNTMAELQEEFGLTYLFIAHDLSVIRHISDRVAIMYLGEIVEMGEKEEIFENPKHPYTKALLDSIPVPDPRASGAHGVLKGEVPSATNPPSGCRFRTRCPSLIAPDSFNLTEEQWEAVRAFMRAVERQTFDPLEESAIRNRFFEDVQLYGEAAAVIDEAIDLIALDSARADGVELNGSGEYSEQWKDAAEILLDAFARTSVCAAQHPAKDVEAGEDSDRFVACHLHR